MKMNICRLAVFPILFFMIIPFSSVSVHAAQMSDDGDVVMDGVYMEFSEKPVVVNGTTMLPFRDIFKALGMSVSWDNEKKIVTGKKKI